MPAKEGKNVGQAETRPHDAAVARGVTFDAGSPRAQAATPDEDVALQSEAVEAVDGDIGEKSDSPLDPWHEAWLRPKGSVATMLPPNSKDTRSSDFTDSRRLDKRRDYQGPNPQWMTRYLKTGRDVSGWKIWLGDLNETHTADNILRWLKTSVRAECSNDDAAEKVMKNVVDICIPTQVKSTSGERQVIVTLGGEEWAAWKCLDAMRTWYQHDKCARGSDGSVWYHSVKFLTDDKHSGEDPHSTRSW